MTSSLVLPTDNAVIDYSIISQMITAINTLQDQVTQLTSASTASTGGIQKTVSKIYVQGTDAGFPKSTSSITVNASELGLTTISAIVGILYAGNSLRTCSLSSYSASSATFLSSGALSNGCKLHVIATGS